MSPALFGLLNGWLPAVRRGWAWEGDVVQVLVVACPYGAAAYAWWSLWRCIQLAEMPCPGPVFVDPLWWPSGVVHWCLCTIGALRLSVERVQPSCLSGKAGGRVERLQRGSAGQFAAGDPSISSGDWVPSWAQSCPRVATMWCHWNMSPFGVWEPEGNIGPGAGVGTLQWAEHVRWPECSTAPLAIHWKRPSIHLVWLQTA